VVVFSLVNEQANLFRLVGERFEILLLATVPGVFCHYGNAGYCIQTRPAYHIITKCSGEIMTLMTPESIRTRKILPAIQLPRSSIFLAIFTLFLLDNLSLFFPPIQNLDALPGVTLGVTIKKERGYGPHSFNLPKNLILSTTPHWPTTQRLTASTTVQESCNFLIFPELHLPDK
jgi:hypothetical protein